MENIVKSYELKEAISKVKETQRAKFTETVDISIKLGIDPKKPEQNVRNSFLLPKGNGRKRVVLAIVDEKDREEVEKAGADFVGSTDMIDKINSGWIDFDVVVTTPDMMAKLSKVGKRLGTKGMMPNVNSGTIVNSREIGKRVEELKNGRVSFRNDKFGLINIPVGKSDFSADDLEDNIKSLIKYLSGLKPATSKGQFIKRVSLSLTMGPSVKLDHISIQRSL